MSAAMKKKVGTWLDFQEIHSTGKTSQFQVRTKSESTLAIIKWNAPWRKYCFFPINKPGIVTIFDADCLSEITSFLTELMLQRKIEKQQQTQNSK